MVKKFKQILHSVKLTKNADPDKYKYSGYSIGFDSRSEFSFTDRGMRKNIIVFGVDMSSSMHFDNKNKNILILCEGPTQGLDDTTLTAEAINFTQPRKRFVLKVYTIMEATVSYLLMLQNISIKSKRL